MYHIYNTNRNIWWNKDTQTWEQYQVGGDYSAFVPASIPEARSWAKEYNASFIAYGRNPKNVIFVSEDETLKIEGDLQEMMVQIEKFYTDNTLDLP